MPDDDLVVLDNFATEIEAKMAKGALESAGIDALIQADSAGGMRPHLAWASGGFKLIVRAQDELEGRAALSLDAGQ